MKERQNIKENICREKKPWKRQAFKAPGLKPRDGLAAINGSNFLTGMSALMCHDTERILNTYAEIACAK